MPTCPCGCATPTSRLFAPGHDSRYKSMLRESSPDVVWNDEKIPVETAIDRITAAIGSDWSAVPSGGKPRPANRPSAPRPYSTPSERSVTPSSPVASHSPRAPRVPRTPRVRRDPISRSERIDRLMDRLDSRGPVVGNWGWYRPASFPEDRLPARVHRTYRDHESSMLDLFVPRAIDNGQDAIVTGIEPSRFFPDHMAKP